MQSDKGDACNRLREHGEEAPPLHGRWLRGWSGKIFLEGDDSTWISKNKNALARWKGEGRLSKQMNQKSKDREGMR